MHSGGFHNLMMQLSSIWIISESEVLDIQRVVNFPKAVYHLEHADIGNYTITPTSRRVGVLPHHQEQSCRSRYSIQLGAALLMQNYLRHQSVDFEFWAPAK